MVSEGTLDIETLGPVRRITIRREEKRNALGPFLLGELAGQIERASAEDSLRLVVLQGAGRCFCSGADLGWIMARPGTSLDESKRELEPLLGLYEALRRSRWPLAAIVQGHVRGGGVGIMAACDFVFAVEGATFLLPEASVGMAPGLASAPIIRRIGEARFLELALGGKKLEGAEAKQWGLVTEVGEDSISWMQKLVQHLQRLAPGAIEEIRITSHEGSGKVNNQYLFKSIAARRISSEAAEGLNARREKRLPSW